MVNTHNIYNNIAAALELHLHDYRAYSKSSNEKGMC